MIFFGEQLFCQLLSFPIILTLPLHEKEMFLRKVSSCAYNKSNTLKAGV